MVGYNGEEDVQDAGYTWSWYTSQAAAAGFCMCPLSRLPSPLVDSCLFSPALLIIIMCMIDVDVGLTSGYNSVRSGNRSGVYVKMRFK